jgi:hypothetical protein
MTCITSTTSRSVVLHRGWERLESGEVTIGCTHPQSHVAMSGLDMSSSGDRTHT